MAKQQILLALDIGTSSTRAVPYDARTCEPVPGAAFAIEHLPDATPDGGSTLDPDRIVQEVVTCAAEALERAGGGTEPLGVGVSCLWHSFAGVDAAGAPQTPILLWSDRRSAAQVERLRGSMDVAAYTQRTGCPLHTSYPLGRLLWLQETHGDVWGRCHRFLSPAEYVFSRLFGPEHTTASHSMASGTGLLDERSGAWDAQTLGVVPGLSADKLSPISDAPAAGLLGPFRERLPALADVPWFPALGDGACSNVGSGATVPGTLALMIGTSGALRAPVTGAVPPVPPGCWRYQIDARRYLLGGALSNGGAVWAWLRRTLSFPGLSDDELEAEISALPPDGHGLTVLPFLYGERAPLWRDDLTAAVLGLRGDTTPLEIARASLEAVAYRFAAVRDALRDAAPTARLIGTGAGLVASRAWAQIIADVLGEPLDISEEPQASARGAALWARELLGLGRIEDAPTAQIAAHVTPDAARGATYAKARARHEAALSRWLGEDA